MNAPHEKLTPEDVQDAIREYLLRRGKLCCEISLNPGFPAAILSKVSKRDLPLEVRSILRASRETSHRLPYDVVCSHLKIDGDVLMGALRQGGLYAHSLDGEKAILTKYDIAISESAWDGQIFMVLALVGDTLEEVKNASPPCPAFSDNVIYLPGAAPLI